MVQANDNQKKVVKPYTYQAKIDFKQKSNKRQKWALSNDHWDNSSGSPSLPQGNHKLKEKTAAAAI